MVSQLAGGNATAGEIPVQSQSSVIRVTGSTYRTTDELAAIDPDVVVMKRPPLGAQSILWYWQHGMLPDLAGTLNAKADRT